MLRVIASWHSFVVNYSCVVDSSKNIKELALDLVPHLFWPAPTIPAIEHVIFHIVVEVAIGGEHIIELVCQTDLWDYVLEEVTEGVHVEKVFVFIQFLDVLVSEAVAVDQ